MAGLSSQVLHIWDVDEQICEIFGIWAVIRCWFMVTIGAIIQRWPQIWIQFSRIWWSNETGSTCQWLHVISCPNIYIVVYRLYIYMYMYCICLFDFIWILWTWVIYYNFENYDDPWELGVLNHSWSPHWPAPKTPGVYHKTDCFICIYIYIYTHTVWFFVKQ